jgi:hypothetical protein
MARRIAITQSDVENLTVAELELLEDRTGRPLSKLFDPAAPRGTLLHALAYISLRRDDPQVSWEDAGDVVVELDAAPEVVGTTADPTPAAAGRQRRRA